MGISVIIPVFNEKPEYLQRLLDSLKAQQYKNFEVIIVDDGSTNRETLSFLENINLDNYFILHKTNGGSGSARNYGLAHAKESLISFLDADDWIDVNFYSRLVDDIYSDKSDIACGVLVLNGKIYEKFSKYKTSSIKEKLKYINHGSVCSKVFKRELFDDITFPEDGLYFEDNPVLLKLLLKAGTVSFDSSAKYHYFENLSSKSHAPEKEEKRRKDSISILKLIKKWASNYDSGVRDLLLLTAGKILFMPEVYNFDEDYKKQINLVYEKKMIKKFLEPDLDLLEKICSLKRSKDKLHKYFTLFGIKFKF